MINVILMMVNVDFDLLEQKDLRHSNNDCQYLPVTKASRKYNERSSSSSQTRTFLHRVKDK